MCCAYSEVGGTLRQILVLYRYLAQKAKKLRRATPYYIWYGKDNVPKFWI